MKKIALTIFLLYITCYLFSQTVEISGTLPGAEGREIRVLKICDWITQEPQTLAKQTISSNGQFSFTLPLSKIEPIILSVAFHKMELMAVPNFKHQLHGSTFSYDDRINPFITPQKLPFQFSKNDTLNRYVVEFENVLEKYEYLNIRQLRDHHNVNLLDSLYKIPDNLSQTLRDFYQKYIFYAIGTEKLNYLSIKPLKLGLYYLNHQTPDPHDYCFMRVFNSYFKNFFPNERSQISFQVVQNLIKQEQSIDTLLDYLGKDPVLADENLRELVALKILQDYFSHINSTKKMLQALGNRTRFKSHQIVAQNILNNFDCLKKGFPAPEFSLLQADGSLVTSNDIKGKYLYIMFLKTNCTECLTEMEQMRIAYEKNKNFFEFITIFLDDKKSDFISFAKNYKYPWKLLYAGNNYDFVQQWQAKSLPSQALITPDYKILEYPTQNVRDGIIQKIEKLSFEENRKKRGQH